MGIVYLPKMTPSAGQKGFRCGDIFIPFETYTPSVNKKGVCLNLDDSSKKAFIPVEEVSPLSETNVEIGTEGILIKGVSGNIFIPVMEPQQTIYDKIASVINENAGVTYTTEVSTFGTFDSSAKWMGGVLANGKIYGIPHAATEILVIDTETDTTSTISCESGSGKWYGACLAPNGKIYCIPYISNKILVIDPITNSTYEFDSPTGDRKWSGGVVGSDGKIYCIPCLSDSVLVIDPETDTTETFGDLSGITTGWKWVGGTLASDGNIYAFPSDIKNKNILKIKTNDKSVELINVDIFSKSYKFQGCAVDENSNIWGIPYTNDVLVSFSVSSSSATKHGSVGTSESKWFGGCLATNGKIYAAPYDSNSILEINPATGETAEIATGLSIDGKYRGCVLAPNGSIYFIPCFATAVMKLSFSGSLTNFSQEICESAVLNKF